VARPEHLLPEDHVADEPVFLLHCEEAAQVALGEIELAQARQHHVAPARFFADAGKVAPRRDEFNLRGLNTSRLFLPSVLPLIRTSSRSVARRPRSAAACEGSGSRTALAWLVQDSYTPGAAMAPNTDAHGVAGDPHSFQQLVRIIAEKKPIRERSWLAFGTIADRIFCRTGILRHGLPFHAGWEAGTASAAKDHRLTSAMISCRHAERFP
jgi:hypothetical protein